jgi:hypothetical protein
VLHILCSRGKHDADGLHLIQRSVGGVKQAIVAVAAHLTPHTPREVFNDGPPVRLREVAGALYGWCKRR